MIQPKIQEVYNSINNLEKRAKHNAFEFSIDYKPWEENLCYKKYAEYGYEKGYIKGFEDFKKENITFKPEKFEQFKREFGKELLEKAAENARAEHVYCYGQQTGEIEIDKESILNTLDDYLLNNKI